MRLQTKENFMPDTLNLDERKIETVRHSEKGFSLLEMIIAMVIFLIVTSSIYAVLLTAQRSRLVVNQQVQLNKSVRIGLNLVGRDALNAGYGYPLKGTVKLPDDKISTLLGVPGDVGTVDDTLPPIIVGNNITLNTFNTVGGVNTDQVTFLFKDSTFNLIGPAGAADDQKISQSLNISAVSTNGDQVTIAASSGTNAVCGINDIFIITGGNGSTLGVATGLSGTDKVNFANTDILGFNKPGNTGILKNITPSFSMQRVRIITYFVTADGTLTRREFANISTATGALNAVDEPIVYGVENFQIKYVLDDGTLTDNPSAGVDGIAGNADDNQSKLSDVRQIRITISARTVELNAAGQPYRATMTSTFSTRNLGYDAE